MKKLISKSLTLARGNGNLFAAGNKGSRGLHSTRSLRSTDFIVSSAFPSISTSADGLTIPELVWSNLHLKDNKVAFVRNARILQFHYKNKYGTISVTNLFLFDRAETWQRCSLGHPNQRLNGPISPKN